MLSDTVGPCRWPGIAITRWGVISFLVLLLAGGSLEAQHVIRGQVVDTAGTGLAGVEVVLAEAGRRGVTDSRGGYAVSNIPTGRYEVVFRRLGYAPFVMFRSFMGDTGTTTVDVQLAAEAVVLPEVETKVRGPEEVPPKLREWARRREFNVGGKFWDDSLLRTQDYRRLPEVLQGIPFVRIIRGAGGRYLATSKGGAEKEEFPGRREFRERVMPKCISMVPDCHRCILR